MRFFFQDFPWLIPVPTKKSDFLPLFSRDSKYNLEVDLSAIRAYGAAGLRTSGTCNGKLVFADLQTSFGLTPQGRLGAGRGGYVDHAYVKGIGRTQLAGNWNDPSDIIHSTGHLSASSAIREYLTTRYLKAIGKAEIIVSCTGLLFRKLDPPLRGHVQAAYGKGSRYVPRMDRSIQALSIRSADFGRASNFVWLLNQPPSKMSFEEIGILLARLLEPAGDMEKNHAKVLNPEKLVESLEKAVFRGLENFKKSFQSGVFWGSIRNNFTLDGRMLDLEMPLILGRPFIGFGAVEHLKRRQEPIGLEVIPYIRESRAFLRYLDYRISYLIRDPDILRVRDKVLATALHQALRKKFSRKHFLFDDEKIQMLLIRTISEKMDVPIQSKARLRDWVEMVFRDQIDLVYQREKAAPFKREDYHRVPLKPIVVHSSLHYTLFSPKFLGKPSRKDFVLAEEINSVLQNLDSSRSPDELLERVARAGAGLVFNAK